MREYLGAAQPRRSASRYCSLYWWDRQREPNRPPPRQLRYILVEVRKLLYAHERVTPDPARIRFVGFGAYSLDLELFA